MFTLSAAGGWFDCDYYEKYFEAAKNGFKAVEMLGWLGLDLDRARAAIDESGVALSCILFQSADPDSNALIQNSHGIVHADAHDAFERAIFESVAAAQKLACKNIVVTSGNERGDVSRYVQHTNIVTALRRVAPMLKGSGVRIVVEPLNVLVNHRGYYLTSTGETAEIIDEVGSPEVMILYDVYHQQITEGNVIDNIRRYSDKIGHIHTADVPGRREPGTGELNYKNILRAIGETGYSDFVAFECGRSVDAQTVCKNMLALLD